MAIEMAEREAKQSAARAFLKVAVQQIGRTLGWICDSIPGGTRRGDKRRQMHLVESLALGNRRQLLLVDCGNQRYLVGAGADSVGTPLAIEPGSISAALSKPAGSAVRSSGAMSKGPHLVRRGARQNAMRPNPGGGLWR